METPRWIWRVWLVVATVLLAVPSAALASYAPVNRPGPALSVPAAKLAGALKCDGPLAGARHAPSVLHDRSAGNAMADIQTAGEYVVYAIRTMHAAYGGRIDIIGTRRAEWCPAGRFWPDTRAMVDDLIRLSPSNHGTLDAIPLCRDGCAASIWQQRSNAKFIAALNSRRETFAGVSYTDVYTLTDEVVVPNFGPAGLLRHRKLP